MTAPKRKLLKVRSSTCFKLNFYCTCPIHVSLFREYFVSFNIYTIYFVTKCRMCKLLHNDVNWVKSVKCSIHYCRSWFCDTNVTKALWITLVKSLLEYVTTSWNHYAIKNIYSTKTIVIVDLLLFITNILPKSLF